MRKTVFVALLSLCLASTAFAECETLTFLTESLPTFDVKEPVNFQIEVIGGDAPYHFELVAGSLPEGLHLTASGRIVGRTTEPSFEHTAFVQVTDANGCQLTQAFAVLVEDL